MTAPLVPVDVDLRDFAFMPLDVVRLRDSGLAAKATGEEFRAAVLLWCASWHQVPAASLPNDDAELANLCGYGRALREWKKVREGALRGWALCDDGRLYHPTVAEKAREAWESKLAQRARTEAARKAREAARQRMSQDQSQSLSQKTESSVTDTATESKGQGQGQGQGIVKDSGAIAPVSSPLETGGDEPAGLPGIDPGEPPDSRIPACPIDTIVAEYHASLPALPRVLVRNAKRDALIRGRWREAFANGKAKDRDDCLALFREFFAHVRDSKFLTGRADTRNGSTPFVADLEWLMRPTNFAKVVEGRYHRG